MALGMLLVIVSLGIDLSAGSVYGFAGTICALCLTRGMGIVPGILLGILSGMIIGLISGLIITRVKIPYFIATLGMLSVVRGLNFIITDSKGIFFENKVLDFLGNGDLWLVPVPAVILIVFGLLLSVMLRSTVFGRRIIAVGGDEDSAVIVGINTARTRLAVYAIAASLFAVGGIIGTGKVSASYPLAGTGYEFDVIASVIIGGASLMGGQGTIYGTILGAIFISALRNSVILLGISRFWQQSLTGIIILIVMIISTTIHESRSGKTDQRRPHAGTQQV